MLSISHKHWYSPTGRCRFGTCKSCIGLRHWVGYLPRFDTEPSTAGLQNEHIAITAPNKVLKNRRKNKR